MTKHVKLNGLIGLFEKETSTAMEKELSRLKSRDPRMYVLVNKKMDEILKYPQRYKQLHGNLKSYRRAHVGTNKILLYCTCDNTVKFQDFGDYNVIYRH